MCANLYSLYLKKYIYISILKHYYIIMKRRLLLQKKIQEDPNYFFRYAKKFIICKTDIGPLMNSSTNSLSNDKYEMCRLLVDQFTRAFTIPGPQ